MVLATLERSRRQGGEISGVFSSEPPIRTDGLASVGGLVLALLLLSTGAAAQKDYVQESHAVSPSPKE
jgi:hypothetical protein